MDRDDDEIDFWTQMEVQAEQAAAAEAAEAAAVTAVAAPGALPTDAGPGAIDGDGLGGLASGQAPTKDDGDGLPAFVSVPEDRADELLRKRELVEALSDGASLSLEGSLLRIHGPPRARRAAERCAIAIVGRHAVTAGAGTSSSSRAPAGSAGPIAEEDDDDWHILPVPEAYVKDWRGSEQELKFEKDFQVLTVVCDAVEDELTKGPGTSIRKVKRLVGSVLEAKWGDKWHLGVGLRPPINAPTTLRIQWAFDGSVTEISPNEVRKLPQFAIFGATGNRIKAMLHLFGQLEEGCAPGISWAYAFTTPALRSFGIEAPPAARVGSRTKDKLTYGPLSTFLKVTGCSSCTFSRVCILSDGRTRSEQQAVIAGSQAARWYAIHMLQFLSSAVDRQRDSPPFLPVPPMLRGECLVCQVPQEVMGGIIGYQQKNINKMMEDFGCLIVMNRHLSGQGKKEATEDDDLVEAMMENLRRGSTQELVLFGPVPNRHHLHAKLMAIVEAKYPGFHRQPDGSFEDVDEHVGFAIDKVWLATDFESDVSDTRGGYLGRAAGCGVFSAGQVVFIAGDRQARRRAREYLPWVLKWIWAKKAYRLPHVTDASARKDLVLMQTVPNRIWGSKWLREQMIKLSTRLKVWAFFDDWVPNTVSGDDEERRRMVIAGVEIERQGINSAFGDEVRAAAQQLLADAEEWEKDGGATWFQKQEKKMKEERENRRRQEEEERKLKEEEEQRQREEAATDLLSIALSMDHGPMPMPSTPAVPSGFFTPVNFGGGFRTPLPSATVPLPATPMPGGALPPPATPMPGFGVPPPSTPGGLLRPPATPMPGGAVRPPATPMPGFGVAPPATPAPGGLAPPATPMPGGLAPPATPMPGGLAPPATPMPSGFGPHGSSAPSTPGAPGGMPSNFGPHGSSAPSTPAPLGFGSVRPPATPGLAPPSTPGAFGARSAGVAPPATPGAFGARPGVVPPATPGAPARVAPPATPGGPGLAPPATPGGIIRGAPPPATPAGCGAFGHAAPSTPTALLDAKRGEKRPLSQGSDLPAIKRPAPATPANLGGGFGGTQTPASGAFDGGSVEQTPERSAAPVRIGARPAPQTPAGLGGTATPAAPPFPAAGKVLSFSTVARSGSGGLGENGPQAPSTARGAAPPAAAKIGRLPLSVALIAPSGGGGRDEPPLPPGWEKKTSKSNGKTYYWNAKLIKSQYHRPTA